MDDSREGDNIYSQSHRTFSSSSEDDGADIFKSIPGLKHVTKSIERKKESNNKEFG